MLFPDVLNMLLVVIGSHRWVGGLIKVSVSWEISGDIRWQAHEELLNFRSQALAPQGRLSLLCKNQRKVPALCYIVKQKLVDKYHRRI